MNRADAKNIIVRMLMDKEWAKLGDRKIAEHVGVSSTTVLRMRQAMEGAGNLSRNSKRVTFVMAKRSRLMSAQIKTMNPQLL
jgi:DNA-binding transcriptional regulator YhcF (GntR family)